MKLLFQSLVLLLLLCFSCTKEGVVTVSGNEPPLVNNVPSVKIENYINRLFIDLIGREPLAVEMQNELNMLRDDDLSVDARITLIHKLQTSNDFIEGDTSYLKAYSQHMYNLAKIKLIEGASDAAIITFSDGNDDGEAVARIKAVLDSKKELEEGTITFDIMMARMINNLVYDQINMNSFNFVNASFDNLLWRYPTNTEFEAGYDMVEHQQAATLFGLSGQNKTEYVEILTKDREMFEGMIIWAYQTFMARRPTTEETANLLDDYFQHKNIGLIQQEIMVTNEYANF